MSYQVSAQQARTTARNDLTIFDETSALMRQVIVDASAGAYQTIVDDGTTMPKHILMYGKELTLLMLLKLTK